MYQSRLKNLMFALCLSLLTNSVFAANLGALNVHSAIGEPLNADIALLSVNSEDLSFLTATIASEEVYVSQGISRNPVHNNITITQGKSADGALILNVRSTMPVNAAFLDLIVQLDWASGRIQREFTVLLNPPNAKASVDQMPSKIDAPVIPQESTSMQSLSGNALENEVNAIAIEDASVDLNTNGAKVAADETTQALADHATSSTFDTSHELTTVRGDTLSAIAKRFPNDGASLEQMLIALYENNQSAFINNNMNQLKVGQIVRVPSQSELYARTAEQARVRVKEQLQQWNVYRSALAGNVEAASATLVKENQQKASGKIAKTNETAEPLIASSTDVVKLSSGEVKNPTSEDTNQAFDEKISALQEETTARKKALLEAQQLSDALEKQIAVMQKLLILKNKVMANVQKNAENASQNKAKLKATPNALQKNNKATFVDDKSLLALPSFLGKQTFFKDWLSSKYLIYITIGLAVALLIAGLISSRNKQKRHLDRLAQRILTPKDLRSNVTLGDIAVVPSRVNSAINEDTLIDANDAFNPLRLGENQPSVDLTLDGLSLDICQNDDAIFISKNTDTQANRQKDAQTASSSFELNLSAISLDLDDVTQDSTSDANKTASKGKLNPDGVINKWY